MSKDYLVEEKIGKRSSSDIVKIFLYSGFIILGLNIFSFFFFQTNTINLGYNVIKKKWEIVKEISAKNKPIKWLILGDSSGNQGVKTSNFEQAFDGNAYNLCTVGNMLTLNDASILDYLTKNGQVPENILLVYVYDIWFRTISLSDLSQAPLDIILNEDAHLKIKLSVKDKVQMYINKYFPLFSRKASIKELIRHPSNLVSQPINFKENGFMPDTVQSTSHTIIDSKGHLDFAKNNSFRVSSYNTLGLQAIEDISEKFGINVYIANSPIHDELLKDKDFMRYYTKTKQFISTLCMNNGWSYINTQPITFKESELNGTDHVTLTASEKYTSKLIEDIKTK